MAHETRRSLVLLAYLMKVTRWGSLQHEFPTWSHSLSVAWLLGAAHLSELTGLSFFARISEQALAAVAVLGALVPVCLRVFSSPNRQALTYPVLLWTCAVASFAPIIANDYSLIFYPLCVLACADVGDPWLARIGILASLLFWQPFLIPISPWILLATKLLGLAGVGASLWRRASVRESATTRVTLAEMA
jgi:hypothetical protein